MGFAARYAAALDAYEAYLIIRDLYKRIGDAAAWADEQYDRPRTDFYVRVNAVSYIEVSLTRKNEVCKALGAVIENYQRHFWIAAGGHPELKKMLVQSGLPYPGELGDTASELGLTYQPKWQRVLFRYRRNNQRYVTTLPDRTDIVVLNAPDAFAAIEYARADHAEDLARIRPLGSDSPTVG